MKVLIVLALVAAASCAPAKEAEREKRNLIGSYPLGYSTGFNNFGVSAGPLVSNQVQQQDTVESQHVQTSNLKSTSTKSLLQPTYQAIQPAIQAYQTYQPAVQTYQTYQPSVQAYQPASYVSYQQPAYYSSAAQVLPVQSSYYNVPSSVQYVSQPSLYNSVYQPSYSALPSYSVSSPVVSSGVVSSGVVGTDPWC
ncbi:uncharacterized protein LOC121734851 [Aricia agestis]|uniref:uncharacterized protein LOC121734851 n=1 Tax=Aricia agestis TaxID=91739 RepID=UPI001C20BAF7|nr:uncharacterized protein LOC121734851 [Aricia agestis]